MRLSETSLEPKQQDAVTRLFDNDETILVMATGDGKTVICLTAIHELIEEGVVNRVIVACPARVVNHWPRENKKWAHLAGLSVVAVTGNPGQRKSRMNAAPEAHVWVTSLNNLDWLLKMPHGADGIIVDELSKAAGKQAKGLKTKRLGDQIRWRVGMTATPVSQDFLKLYGMCRIIDKGKALGTNKQGYEEEYFNSDYHGYNLTLRDGADVKILDKVKGLVHAVEDTKAQHLPPLHYIPQRFVMPDSTREVYNEMKKDMLIEGMDLAAANSAVQTGKLRQIASGFIYDEQHKTRFLDISRVMEAINWVEDLHGEPGIIFFEYIEQGAELSKTLNSTFVIENFPKKFPILLAQAQSLSHGIDGLQYSCSNILIYQPIWSRDISEQIVGRVWRKGQTRPVNVTTLICEDTLDDVVINRVDDRGEWMKLFMAHLKG